LKEDIMRQAKGIAILTSLVGLLIFTVITFSYGDFVALVRAQYGDYDDEPPAVTLDDVRELFKEILEDDPDFDITDEKLDTLGKLVLVRALVADSVSDELGAAILAIITACPDLVGLAYTEGDSESDEVIASIVDEDDMGLGLAANGEGLLVNEDELEAAFPVQDVVGHLTDVFADLAAERYGEDIELEQLAINAIEGIIEDMDTLVFAVEPNFLLEAELLEYNPKTGYVSLQATMFDEDDNIIGEARFKVIPVGEAEDEAEQQYLIGIAPLPEEEAE
jgi:hypothetical protein